MRPVVYPNRRTHFEQFLNASKRLTVVLAAFATPLCAQGAVSSVPAQPDSTLTPSEADLGFAAWLRAQLDAGRREAPVLIQRGRFEVLAMSPLARASLEPDSVFAPMVAACADRLKLAAADVDEVGSLRPWEAFDRAAARVPVFAFSIIPSHAGMIDCGASDPARNAALARGVRFGQNPVYSPTNDATRAELWVDGVLVPPALVGREPVTQVAQSRLRRDGTNQVRIYVPLDRLAPDDRGRLPQVELRVWNASDGDPERILVSAEDLHRLWTSEMRWRSARIVNTSEPTTAGPSLPTPRDTVLRTALSRLAAGDRQAAAVLTSDRLADGRLKGLDRMTGHLIMGLAFDAEGDAAAARIAFADAVTLEPCLSFNPAVDPHYGRMLDGPRPEARCWTRPLTLVAATALIPGLGQYATGRRLPMAAVFVGAVATSFVAAQGKYAEGREAFAQYEAITSIEANSPFQMGSFNRAERARQAGNSLVQIGATVWVLAGIEAIFFEYRHARALRAVQGFGGPPARVGLTSIPGGIGLSVELFR